MFKRLKNKNGFSLIEAVLYISLSGLIFGVTSQALTTHINAYSFISSRQTAIGDVRYALNAISTELNYVESSDLISIAPDNISFIDLSSTNTSFSVGTVNGEQALLRGGEVLISPISDFQIDYYDANHNPTTVLNDVRIMDVTVATEEVANEGTITLETTIVPRAFVYNNYQ